MAWNLDEDWGIHPKDEDGPRLSDGCTFKDVRVLKVSKTGKGLYVKFASGQKFWVPVGQVVSGPDQAGETGDLTVTDWIAERWAEEGFDPDKPAEEESVSIPGVTCLKEGKDEDGRGPKAIWCRFPAGQREWIPTSQILEASEVHRDGDVGTLVITAWIAGEKNLGPGGKKAPTAQTDLADEERGKSRIRGDSGDLF